MKTLLMNLINNVPEPEEWMKKLELETETELKVYTIIHLYTKTDRHFIGSTKKLADVLNTTREDVTNAIDKLLYRNLLVKTYLLIDTIDILGSLQTNQLIESFTPMYKTYVPENIRDIL